MSTPLTGYSLLRDRRRLHDIARPQHELIEASVDEGTDRHPFEFDLGFCKLRLRAGLLCREERRNVRLSGLSG